jgi:hypothetical protein
MRAAEWYVGGWGKRKKRVRSSALVHTICWMRARVNEHTRYACVMIAGFLRLGQRIMTQTARPFPAEYTKLDAQARLTMHTVNTNTCCWVGARRDTCHHPRLESAGAHTHELAAPKASWGRPGGSTYRLVPVPVSVQVPVEAGAIRSRRRVVEVVAGAEAHVNTDYRTYRYRANSALGPDSLASTLDASCHAH